MFDTLTSISTVYVLFDNGTGIDFNRTATNQSGQWNVSYNVSVLNEGKQGARFVANDTVDNTNSSYFINFTVDLNSPNVTINSPSDGATLSGVQVFNASIFDVLTEVRTVIIQFGNTTAFNRTASNYSGNWNVTLNTSSLTEGSLTVTFFANDSVGNMNNSQTLSLTIDNVADEVSAGSGGGSSSSIPPAIPKPANFTYADTLEITTKSGSFFTKIIEIRNNQNKDINVTFDCEGNICKFLQYDQLKLFPALSKLNYEVKVFIPKYSLKSEYGGAITFSNNERIDIKAEITFETKEEIYNFYSQNKVAVISGSIFLGLAILSFIANLIIRKYKK